MFGFTKKSMKISNNLHSTTHNCVQIAQTKRYNVSLKDEYYDMVYKPLYLDI